MMKKKKCLLILPRSVFPTISGYAIKNKNVIELLSETYDLTLVVLKETAFTEEERSYYKVHSRHSILWVRSKWKSYLGAFSTLLAGKPLQVGYYYDRQLQKKIDSALEQCDVAVAVLERTIEYLKNIPEQKLCVFDIVDSIALNYQRSKAKTTSLFWKLLYTIEGGRLMRYERTWIAKADLTYFINQDEYAYWKEYGNACWLPHGVKQELLTYTAVEPKYQDCVAFIGKMDYQPNVDAMVWYLKNVHSVIGREIPLVIVGACPAKELEQLAAGYENVTITGFVEDPYVILNSALALVAPMQTGGGIQNKVLEGMALGKVNVITTLAARPISGTEDRVHYVIADTADEFVERLREIKANPAEYEKIGMAARQHILEYFTWDAYNRVYLEKIGEFSVNKE